ncbi:hypothetical protein DFH06DRAFT_1476605 [Mycena polygramma]|nr:hypothetical protein DFH06DRAFT_1476605 [Mycena polygramma]
MSNENTMSLPKNFIAMGNLRGRFRLNPQLSHRLKFGDVLEARGAEEILRKLGVKDVALRDAVTNGTLSLHNYEKVNEKTKEEWIRVVQEYHYSGDKRQAIETCCVATHKPEPDPEPDQEAPAWPQCQLYDPILGLVDVRMRRIKIDADPVGVDSEPVEWDADARKYGVLQREVSGPGRTWVVNETWGMALSQEADLRYQRRFVRYINVDVADEPSAQWELVYDYLGDC